MIATNVFVTVLFAPALVGILLSCIVPKYGNILGKLCCCVSCVVGISAFFVNYGITDRIFVLPIDSALGEYRLLFDDLSSIVISLSSLVFLLIVLHSLKNSKDDAGKYAAMLCILFISCILAMCADSVILLLLSWEMVTLTTFLMSYGADNEPRWMYFVVTHVGGFLIMCVFIGLSVINGTVNLSEMTAIDNALVSSVMIFLLFIGFGTKLGCVPFHAWMPDLYDSSPIHSTALLSTVCSNVAILLLIKSTFLWIGVPDNILLPLVIILLASLSAIWGAMESLIQLKPRKILAYSSMENMAMVILCLGVGMIFHIMDFDTAYLLMILVAGLLHTINHSFFKSLMLLNVDTVENSTGTKNIDKMGGLAKILPLLSIFSLIGVLSMAAVPPMNGFISEWLMIKTVISSGVGNSIINVILPLIITVLGVCGTMAAVSYARLYGFIFLGRPKSAETVNAKKIDKISLIPLGALSVSCILLGILSMPLISTIIDGLCGTLNIPHMVVDNIPRALNPAIIALMIVSSGVIVYLGFKYFRKNVKTEKTWDCGTELEPNMQYSSAGFTQPLVNVFHPIYGDVRETIGDSMDGISSYKVIFSDPFNKFLLIPVAKTVMKVSKFVGKLQNGNIQTYLAYLLITLIVVLLGGRFL